MIIPVAGLRSVIPSATVTVRTWTGGSVDVYGRYTASGQTDVAEDMPVHPATSRRFREMVPEASRDRELIALYPGVGTALARTAGTRAPEVQYKGRWYVVVNDADYEDQGAIRLVVASLKDETT